jgi:prephenate dehydratase
MSAPSKFSFRGCRTHAEALSRCDPWITNHLEDGIVKLADSLAGAVQRGELSADSAEAAIAEATAVANQTRLELLRMTAEWLAEVVVVH